MGGKVSETPMGVWRDGLLRAWNEKTSNGLKTGKREKEGRKTCKRHTFDFQHLGLPTCNKGDRREKRSCSEY